MARRIVGDIPAVPHGADHIDWRLARRGPIALRDFAAEITAREKDRAVTVIVVRQYRIIDDEGERKSCKDNRPDDRYASKASRIKRAVRVYYDPDAEEEPERIAPHRHSAAAA